MGCTILSWLISETRPGLFGLKSYRKLDLVYVYVSLLNIITMFIQICKMYKSAAFRKEITTPKCAKGLVSENDSCSFLKVPS